MSSLSLDWIEYGNVKHNLIIDFPHLHVLIEFKQLYIFIYIYVTRHVTSGVTQQFIQHLIDN